MKTVSEFPFALDRTLVFLLAGLFLVLLFVNALLVVLDTNSSILAGPLRYVTHQLNLDAEGNFATWYSSMLLLLNAFYAYHLACSRRASDRPASFAYMLLALGFVFLSLDDFISLHEFLERVAATMLPSRDTLALPGEAIPGSVYGLGLASILTIVGAGVYWSGAVKRENLLILTGCVLYVFLVGLAERAYVQSGCFTHTCFRFEVLIEEGSELLAMLLFLLFQSREFTWTRLELQTV